MLVTGNPIQLVVFIIISSVSTEKALPTRLNMNIVARWCIVFSRVRKTEPYARLSFLSHSKLYERFMG